MAKKKIKLTLEKMLEQALVPTEEQFYQVPENWCWVKLFSIADIVTGGTPSKKCSEYYDGKFPFIKPTDLDQGRYVYDASEYLTEEGKNVSRVVPSESICVCCIGSIGKCGYLVREATTNQQINSVIPKINSLFLFYMLSSEFFKSSLKSLASSTTIEIVNKSKMENISIPLPPIEEQERIAKIIDNLFSKLDEAREIINYIKSSFAERMTTILYDAFEGKLTKKWREDHPDIEGSENYLDKLKQSRMAKNRKKGFDYHKNNNYPETWCETKLDKFIYFAGRIGWKGLKAEEYTKEGALFLSVYNLNYGDYVDYRDAKHISDERYNESPEIMLEESDILLAKDGAGIGKLGYVKNLPGKATINSSLLLLRAGESVHSKYLYYFLKGPKIQSLVKERITGSATPHLFQKDIKEFVLPVPPYEEQIEIIRILDIITIQENAATNLINIDKNIELIKKSILAKAFRGELSTNILSESSSINLLKKILEQNIKDSD